MRYSLFFRIWHWLNAFVIIGLLGTVFLRKTFLSWRSNSELIIDKLFDMDIDITATQAKVLAKAIRAGMWEWHIILGYTLAFLILFRLYLYFMDNSKKENFNSLTLHKKVVRSSYYVIYITLTFMVITGFMMYLYKDLGLAKATIISIKDIHELTFYLIMYFVPVHIVGVIIAENTYEKGLVSSMLNGKE